MTLANWIFPPYPKLESSLTREIDRQIKIWHHQSLCLKILILDIQGLAMCASVGCFNYKCRYLHPGCRSDVSRFQQAMTMVVESARCRFLRRVHFWRFQMVSVPSQKVMIKKPFWNSLFQTLKTFCKNVDSLKKFRLSLVVFTSSEKPKSEVFFQIF